MANIHEVRQHIGNRNGAKPEKRIASELRCSPTMEKILFEEALEPYLTMLESLGATPVDVEKTYLKLTTAFLLGSSTQKVLLDQRLGKLDLNRRYSQNNNGQGHNGTNITLNPGVVEHLI